MKYENETQVQSSKLKESKNKTGEENEGKVYHHSNKIILHGMAD